MNQFDFSGLKGQIISKHASAGDEICSQSLQLFVETYGAEAGLTCLKFLPYGGLYLAGGLTPKIIDLLRGPTSVFRKAMLDKGRLSSTVEYIPVFAVMVEDLAERGCYSLNVKDYCLKRRSQRYFKML